MSVFKDKQDWAVDLDTALPLQPPQSWKFGGSGPEFWTSVAFYLKSTLISFYTKLS